MLRWVLNVAGVETLYVCMVAGRMNAVFSNEIWRRKLTRVGESMFLYIYIYKELSLRWRDE